jgi:hypothetical protein
MRVITKRIRKTTNRIHAIWVAAPAMPLSPRTPAISPMIRKVMLQLSISSFSFLKDRTAKFRLKTYSLLLPAPMDSVGPLIALAIAESQQRLRIGLAGEAGQTFRKEHFDCANELRFPHNPPSHLYLLLTRQTLNASGDHPASIR